MNREPSGESIGSLLGKQDGFSLIEAVVAVGIFSIAVGGMLSAMLAVMRPLADSRWSAQLTGVAQNVLADLRASSAYDTTVLAAAAGTQTRFTVPPFTVAVTYRRRDPNSPVHAVVQVVDARQHVVTIDGVLAQEAPAPGAVLSPFPSRNLASPPPSPPQPSTVRAGGGM